jgi:hypothetical protein
MSDAVPRIERKLLACYLALALLAGALVAWATPHGLVIYSGDSLNYVEGARNIVAGNGYSASIPPAPREPIVHFPPLYPMAIAAVDAVIHKPYPAARWVSILCFAGSAFLICAMVWRATGGNFLAGLAAGILFTVNPTLIWQFTEPLSETIFILLALAGQTALIEALTRNRLNWLLVAALFLGATVAARYSGIVWIATGALTVLFCARGGVVARLGRAILFGVVSMLPGVAMAIRNRLVSGSSTGRSLGMHAVSAGHLLDGMQTIAGWFLPWRFARWPYGVAVSLALARLVIHALRTARKAGEPRFGPASVFWISTGTFAVLYYAHLLLAISFLHYNTPMDDRILAPLEVCAIACLGAWLGLKTSANGVRVVCAVIILLSAVRGYTVIEKCRINSGGYAGPMWKSRPVMLALQRLPPDAVVYSNKPEAIYLATGRPVLEVPNKQDPMTLLPNKDADAEFAKMEQDLKANNGVLVYFAPLSTDQAYDGGVPLSRLHEFGEPELEARLRLQTVLEANGVDLLKLAPQPGQ